MDEIQKGLQEVFSKIGTRQPPTSSEQNLPPPLTEAEYDAALTKLWIVMSEAYGYKWVKPMGEEPNQTWIEGLRDLTLYQWRTGLITLNQSTDEWPPSLPEFRRWCIGAKTKEQLKAHSESQASAIMGECLAKYNPNVVPMNYEQAERAYSRLARQLYVMEEENTKRKALGLDEISDPERICIDSDYR